MTNDSCKFVILAKFKIGLVFLYLKATVIKSKILIELTTFILETFTQKRN